MPGIYGLSRLLDLNLGEIGRDRLVNLVGLVLVVDDEGKKVAESKLELGDVLGLLDGDRFGFRESLLLSSGDFDEILKLSNDLGLKE